MLFLRHCQSMSDENKIVLNIENVLSRAFVHLDSGSRHAPIGQLINQTPRTTYFDTCYWVLTRNTML